MFCSKCGAEVDNMTTICPKCGNNLNLEDTDKTGILLNVKPKYNLLYKGLIFIFLTIIFLVCLLTVSPMVGIKFAIITFVILVVLEIIVYGAIVLIQRMRYKYYNYDFYNDKVIYRDDFFKVTEKEIKYKDIKEITMQQTFTQRWFGLGNIVLNTNAENGLYNGITIIDVANPDEVCKKLRQIINDN